MKRPCTMQLRTEISLKKNNMRYLSLLFGCLVSVFLLQTASAQDPHFAQFYTAPMYYNPALTGVHEGHFRVTTNYREQWGVVLADNPYRTFALGFDNKERVGKGDYLAYGFTMMRDEAGDARLQRVNALLSLNYMKQLSGNRYRRSDQYLAAGFQVGFGQQSVDYSNLWFSTQFNVGEIAIDPMLPTGENLLFRNKSYLDFNAGLLYYALFGDRKSLYLGGSLSHLNRPNISILGVQADYLPMRWLGQAGAELPLGKSLSMLPAVLVMGQGPSFTTIFGANFRYTNRDWREIAIRAGLWGQVSNFLDSNVSFPSMIAAAILEIDRLQIGISYDVNMGAVSEPTNSRGGVELSFIYVHPAAKRIRVNCPRF